MADYMFSVPPSKGDGQADFPDWPALLSGSGLRLKYPDAEPDWFCIVVGSAEDVARLTTDKPCIRSDLLL